MAPPPTPSWRVSIATSLSQHLVEQGFNTWYKLTTTWKTSWGVFHWGAHAMTIQSHQKQHMLISRRRFLQKHGTLSIILGTKHVKYAI